MPVPRPLSVLPALPDTQGYIAAFVYSNDPNWARNLPATGEGQMTRAGRTYSITNPRRLGKDAIKLVPPAVAAITRVLGVQGFLQFDAAPSQ